MKPAYNRHHLQFSEREHSKYSELRDLRELPQNIIRMPVRDHDELHRNVSYVPSTSLYIARRALHELIHTRRPKTAVESVSRLQDALYNGAEDERVDTIEYQVTQIAIQALEMQKPFLPVKTPRVYDLAAFS